MFSEKGILSALGTEAPVCLWEHTTQVTRSPERQINILNFRKRQRPAEASGLINCAASPSPGRVAHLPLALLLGLSVSSMSSGGCHLPCECQQVGETAKSWFLCSKGQNGPMRLRRGVITVKLTLK